MLFRPRSYLFLINNIYKDLAYKISTDHHDISLLSCQCATLSEYRLTFILAYLKDRIKVGVYILGDKSLEY